MGAALAQGYARMVTPVSRRRVAWNGDGSFGGTFGIQWDALVDVPFQRTLHLQNPWNEGKPVKISRDGQARGAAADLQSCLARSAVLCRRHLCPCCGTAGCSRHAAG